MSATDPLLMRLSDLAVDHLLGELSAEDAIEYRQLRGSQPDFDLLALERAAAALHLAAETEFETLPERLRIRLATSAGEFFADRWRGAESSAAVTTLTIEPRGTMNPRAGWWAAAATLLLALGLWITRPAPSILSPPQAIVAEAVGLAAKREQLLAANRTALVRSWRAGNDPAGSGVRGDVVWDASGQRGYMRFSGLRPNNPKVEQYQLWIFDAQRDERYPIDGGVFNISSERGEEVVAIKAALKVGVPLTFAVTLERPGGVVVSDRSRIAALANTG